MEGLSQDHCHALAAPFQALKSNAHQRAALKALVEALTHDQIRALRLSLEKINLHCDIIADLPLEISQIIVQHLPLYQVFQARRVSSRWRQVLSSPQTVEPLLRCRFPTLTADTSLHIPKCLSANSIVSLKAEHIDAYRTGHAFSYARYQWDCFKDDDWDCNPMAYADGILAWVDTDDGHLVKSLDFKTGEQQSFLPESRTRITAIAVSSSMVAALGSGRCHVWNLRTGACYFLRLPSAGSPEFLAVSGETLAYVHLIDRHEASSRAEVVTWTMKDQRTLSFSVPMLWKDGVIDFNAMLDKKGETLVLFKELYKYPQGGPAHFQCLRTSLDGNVVTEGGIEVPDSENYQSCSMLSAKLLKEANGQAVIWSFTKHHHDEHDTSTLMNICYNFKEDRLEVRKQIVTDFGSNRTEMLYRLQFHWKDAGYFMEVDQNELMVVDLVNSTCSKAKMDFPFGDPKLNKKDGSMHLRFGDEIFLICVAGEGFCVWCFDANVQLFNEDIAYKEQRKSNRDRRLLLKQDGKNFSADDSVTRKLD